MRIVRPLAGLALPLLLAACEEPADDLTGRRRNHRLDDDSSEEDSTAADKGDPTQPGSCQLGTSHIGFAQVDFAAERKPGALGQDRRRIKPYTAMQSEMERVLGVAPTALAQSSAAFGEVPARWYIEPTAGAVSLYTSYTLAFSACYTSLDDAASAVAPTATTAASKCAELQQKAWQRSPTAAETQACSAFVMSLSSETPRRRWAHACASILSAAGFTTY